MSILCSGNFGTFWPEPSTTPLARHIEREIEARESRNIPSMGHLQDDHVTSASYVWLLLAKLALKSLVKNDSASRQYLRYSALQGLQTPPRCRTGPGLRLAVFAAKSGRIVAYNLN
eukprot:jgi/Botrbrau1/22918/Bobra.0906s0002.1